MESVLSPRLKLEKRKGMHCSPSIRNWRESCFIVGIKEAKSSSSMSRYRDSLSLFFLFSSLFSLLYRPLSTTRGMRSERMLWPEMRFVPCNASLSLCHFDRSPFSIVAGSTDVYLDAAIIGLVFLLRATRVSRLVWSND